MLSEITSIRGDEVISFTVTGERNISQHSNYQWRKKRPNKKTWKLRKNAISKIYCIGKFLQINPIFRLSIWILPPSKRYTNFYFQFSLLTQEIYIKNSVTIFSLFNDPYK